MELGANTVWTYGRKVNGKRMDTNIPAYRMSKLHTQSNEGERAFPHAYKDEAEGGSKRNRFSPINFERL